MKLMKFFLLGIVFGVVLTKTEVISWFRIYEMFRFQSFHMYGVIGSSVLLGAVMIQIIKKTSLKGMDGEVIRLIPKSRSVINYLVGGIIFGLGWALVGTCPGPMFILLGQGSFTILVVIAGAIAGTFVYGLLRNKLPH